ncbi:fibronectin type III domain-containing protein [Candidatus Parcubacteria bacterium]|nr:fibronectin type III domain-containing protein [Candidatus Parcubacteria bacterium]
MKKTLILAIMFSFLMWGCGIVLIKPTAAAIDNTGKVIKGKGMSTLYYVGEDGKRYVFPNDKTYFSWFDDFSGVEEVNDEDLYDYQLGGNVRYKPGALLVKIQTDPKVYAVGQNGKLHWIVSEAVARDLYGANWNLLIDDVPDSFFTNYAVDDPVETADEYDPEEEEGEIPTISYNRGFKTRLVKQYQESKIERSCQRLEGFITRVQARLARWGLETDELGADYLDQCFNSADENQNQAHERWGWLKDHKVEICHVPPGSPENAHSIWVSNAAAKAHLAKDSYLGPCNGETDPDPDPEDPDTTPPTISNIATSTVTDQNAVVKWTTDEAATGKVIYSESSDVENSDLSVSDDSFENSHSLNIPDLTPSTKYYYIIVAVDEDGNKATSTEDSFTTLAEPDITPPIISNVATSSVATSSAVISWDTNEATTGKVIYSESSDVENSDPSVSDDSFKYSHSLELTGLATSTEYFFRVESEDEAGNIATSTEDSFTTTDS